MSKSKAETQEKEEVETQSTEQTEVKETKSNALTKVLKSIGALSHEDRLKLYDALNKAAEIDKDKFSIGITDHDATGAYDEIIKGL